MHEHKPPTVEIMLSVPPTPWLHYSSLESSFSSFIIQHQILSVIHLHASPYLNIHQYHIKK